jgi:hypothetical protein
MIGKICLTVGFVAVLSLAVAGCGPPAPTIPHEIEGLAPVDCLACHELGLEGAAKIPDKHLDDEGEVRYDDCRCHKHAPVEEQTTSDQGVQMSGAIEMGGLVVGSVGLAAIGMLVVSRGKQRHLDS